MIVQDNSNNYEIRSSEAKLKKKLRGNKVDESQKLIMLRYLLAFTTHCEPVKIRKKISKEHGEFYIELGFNAYSLILDNKKTRKLIQKSKSRFLALILVLN